jgi:hypothetical protein
VLESTLQVLQQQQTEYIAYVERQNCHKGRYEHVISGLELPTTAQTLELASIQQDLLTQKVI